MFPFHQDDNPLYQIYSNSFQQDTIKQDQTLGHVAGEGSTNSFMINNLAPKRNTLSTPEDNHGNQGHDKKKKIHRDVERQRRQEMAAHFSTLRSLLPYEFIKGKRSMSDQINGAGNYIKHMQKRVSELAANRDKLQKVFNLIETSSKSAQRSVVAKYYGGCLEIIYKSRIGNDSNEQEFPLSEVLNLLLNEGHEIVNLVSTKVGNDVVHTIMSQVSDSRDVDLSELQQKLMDAVP